MEIVDKVTTTVEVGVPRSGVVEDFGRDTDPVPVNEILSTVNEDHHLDFVGLLFNRSIKLVISFALIKLVIIYTTINRFLRVFYSGPFRSKSYPFVIKKI